MIGNRSSPNRNGNRALMVRARPMKVIHHISGSSGLRWKHAPDEIPATHRLQVFIRLFTGHFKCFRLPGKSAQRFGVVLSAAAFHSWSKRWASARVNWSQQFKNRGASRSEAASVRRRASSRSRTILAIAAERSGRPSHKASAAALMPKYVLASFDCRQPRSYLAWHTCSHSSRRAGSASAKRL